MNALAFPTMRQGFPCAPGSTWSWQGTRVIRKVIAITGMYMPSPGLVSVDVETIGGGAGGGFCVQGTNTLGGGGGGGSGGRSLLALPAPLVQGGVMVTIGPGGSGALNPDTLVGAPGGPTSFGSLCIANGGMGGGGNNSSTIWGEPGAGALPGIGDIAFPGNPGTPGTSQTIGGANLDVVGGQGGAIMGGGAIAIFAPANAGAAGQPGLGYGSGGGGAAVNQATAGYVGGDGAPGVCIVLEYCVAASNMDGCGCGCARVPFPAWGCAG
jgi:hypothetical protein